MKGKARLYHTPGALQAQRAMDRVKIAFPR
jgi:hypothetical protein